MELDIDLIALQRLLVKHFDLDELKGLCFDLQLDYDDLAGETKSAKSRELVKHCYRHGLLDELYGTAKAHRPATEWQNVLEQRDAGDLPEQWIEPLQRLFALVRKFNRNRHQPFSDRRTNDGDEIAFQMREVAPFVFNQFNCKDWLGSSSPGKRLAAIKYLDWLQDVEFLNDLLKKLVSEGPFIQLHALLAIHTMVDQIEGKRIDLIKSAMVAYQLSRPDTTREYWRQKIIRALDVTGA